MLRVPNENFARIASARIMGPDLSDVMAGLHSSAGRRIVQEVRIKKPLSWSGFACMQMCRTVGPTFNAHHHQGVAPRQPDLKPYAIG